MTKKISAEAFAVFMTKLKMLNNLTENSPVASECHHKRNSITGVYVYENSLTLQ